jgi:ceramide glucosyltransferase
VSLDIGSICAALAALGCVYLVVAIAAAAAWKPSKDAGLPFTPEPVTILKPLYGDEPRLQECLTSFCAQDYAAPLQIVFGLHNRADPALPVVQSVKASRPSLPAAAVIDGKSHGINAKVSNLINMMAAAEHDVLIAADSDILVKEDYTARIVRLLQKPDVGAVTVLYHGEATETPWSRIAALLINTHFLPNVLVGTALNLAKPCFGSTIALRRKTLRAIGGFEAFSNQLADDYLIGEAVRRLDRKVEIAAFSVAHVCHEASLRDLLHHQLRWARTVKAIDLPGYLGSFIAHPFGLALLGIAAGNGYCPAVAALALGLRLVLCKIVERKSGLGRQPYWMLPVTDLISFAVFIWSFLGAGVTWKHTHYTVLSDGTLAGSSEG